MEQITLKTRNKMAQDFFKSISETLGPLLKGFEFKEGDLLRLNRGNSKEQDFIVSIKMFGIFEQHFKDYIKGIVKTTNLNEEHKKNAIEQIEKKASSFNSTNDLISSSNNWVSKSFLKHRALFNVCSRNKTLCYMDNLWASNLKPLYKIRNLNAHRKTFASPNYNQVIHAIIIFFVVIEDLFMNSPFEEHRKNSRSFKTFEITFDNCTIDGVIDLKDIDAFKKYPRIRFKM